jgi:hypothetical protein
LISFPRENIKIVKERKVKNIFPETGVKKNKKFLNKMKSLLLLFINLIIFTYFLLLANAQRQPSIVTLRYNKTGPVRILNEQFSEKPNRVYINDTLLDDEISHIIYLDNDYLNNLMVEIEGLKLSFNGALSGHLNLRRAINMLQEE